MLLIVCLFCYSCSDCRCLSYRFWDRFIDVGIVSSLFLARVAGQPRWLRGKGVRPDSGRPRFDSCFRRGSVSRPSHFIIIIFAFGPYLSIGRLEELCRILILGRPLKLSPSVTHALRFSLQIAAPGVSWAASLSLSLRFPGQGLTLIQVNESCQWLKNYYSSGYPARCLAF